MDGRYKVNYHGRFHYSFGSTYFPNAFTKHDTYPTRDECEAYIRKEWAEEIEDDRVVEGSISWTVSFVTIVSSQKIDTLTNLTS